MAGLTRPPPGVTVRATRWSWGRLMEADAVVRRCPALVDGAGRERDLRGDVPGRDRRHPPGQNLQAARRKPRRGSESRPLRIRVRSSRHISKHPGRRPARWSAVSPTSRSCAAACTRSKPAPVARTAFVARRTRSSAYTDRRLRQPRAHRPDRPGLQGELPVGKLGSGWSSHRRTARRRFSGR